MKYLTFVAFCFFSLRLIAQDVIKLYDVVPNNRPNVSVQQELKTDEDGVTVVSNVTFPELYVFKPDALNGTAVIICPGGGYSILAINKEGFDVAKALTAWGVTAFVLKYRLPNDKLMLDKSIAPLQDAERAIQLVRDNAKTLKLKKHGIGIMGFSAGGHLAASLSTRYNETLIENPKHISLCPDFSVLIYPLISFTDSLTHLDSRTHLIGTKPSSFKIEKYSNELHVDKKTPPTFLVHAKDDQTVSVQNSTIYYDKLLQNGVAAKIFYFDKGGHGFGVKNPLENVDWMDALKAFMHQQNFL